jgi:hypothetical protein
MGAVVKAANPGLRARQGHLVQVHMRNHLDQGKSANVDDVVEDPVVKCVA